MLPIELKQNEVAFQFNVCIAVSQGNEPGALKVRESLQQFETSPQLKHAAYVADDGRLKSNGLKVACVCLLEGIVTQLQLAEQRGHIDAKKTLEGLYELMQQKLNDPHHLRSVETFEGTVKDDPK